ncbi:MAG: bifunctional acetate--CoA ligase family protein/GNAT family N-acetyltransferase [candidate division KSB1 bacterium]|nr:bifunctional acetate--CoA ligase family protein/GNAT family N-acetyltransferase [candidate division KSB1 bacterium]MDZ7318447.1 bifunctional acetate--CoA ligase family protein/GNAT family N-acetyltransferase [candidate division KSB1 bacterium]MDZ7340105.1 bifunctional acetate--CoA ligase family protein/GNAT family N-acetyltransferase [candidate division KSB1 bacterium]
MHKLDRFFKPQRIALLGVTPNPKSVGGKVLSNLVGGGFRGVVYPVNPTSEAVLGIPCYPDVKSLPKTPDLALICSPAEQVPALVRQCGEAGILGIIILSAGFREIGEAGKLLEQEVAAEAHRFDGMRIIGPNCLGIIVPSLNLNASFGQGMPPKGHVAFISQSGALCTSVLDWALEEKVGFSYFVSIGNTMDVDFGDLIDYFGEDEDTKSILLYIESIEHARKFMTAARAFARTKPIVAYKAGRFPESAAVAASHTGAMAAEDAVYDAAFHRAGLARVFDIGEIFDVAELIGRHKIPKGPRLGIVTNAGGPGVMATDALIAEQGVLAQLTDESMAALNENLPHFWSHGNPVDVLGDAPPKRIARATEIVLEDAGVDAVLIIITPQAMTDPTLTAQRIGELADKTKKPILAAWLGGMRMRDGIRLLNEVGIPTYTTPEQAVRAFMTMVAYSRNLASLYETPKDIPVTFSLDRDQLRQEFSTLIKDAGELLAEGVAKKLLAAYGIPVTEPLLARNADEAVRFADQIGYPVVLKVQSPDISHKTDVGGVALDLPNAELVREAFHRIAENAKASQSEAQIEGITVQKMIQGSNSIELILGIKKDKVFGTVIMVGLGGVTAELFGDKALGLPPLNERLARGMLESLKIWPLLRGYRGHSPVDIEQLITIMIRLSYLAADYPEIKELDINPLFVSPQEIVALDARIIIDRELVGTAVKPYAHLALRPYPEEYVRPAELKNGDRIILRPIKPEDEPMWMNMLASCSRESIYQRFRYFFQWAHHEVAVRYCFIDYDREIAIVAELNENGTRKLLGVGRLVGDPELETAEYAVLVADAWQDQGLGSLLTDYCIEIAQHMGVKKIFAQTTTDNPRMIAVFRKRNFDIQIDPSSSLVEVAKTL